MSVNEVKLKPAAEPFVVRGTGPPSSRTFCIGDEDHTMGNALRHILMQNSQVGFAGYSVPHPSEPVVQIRVQTVAPPGAPSSEAPTALDTLQKACQTLSAKCDIVMHKSEGILPEVQEDRQHLERFVAERSTYENYDDDDDDEMEE